MADRHERYLRRTDAKEKQAQKALKGKRKRKETVSSDKENKGNYNSSLKKPKKHERGPEKKTKRTTLALPLAKRNSRLSLFENPEELLKQELEKWPAELNRYTYTVIPRSFFGKLDFLANGGLGAILTSSLSVTGMCHREAVFSMLGTPGTRKAKRLTPRSPDRKRSTRSSDNARLDIVLKVCLDEKDWNDEIAGYYSNRGNPGVVPIMGVVLLSAAEVDRLCACLEDYVPRQSGWVPTMMFERWDGSLNDAMEQGLLEEWGPLTVLDVLIDLSKAVAGLHAAGNLHRDIKPKNALYKVQQDQNKVRCALCDLGLATSVTKRPPARIEMTQEVGSEEYMAPEVRSGTRYHTPADIYSLCVTTKEVIDTCESIQSALAPYLSSFLRQASSKNPDNRPTARDFIKKLTEVKEKLQSQEDLSDGEVVVDLT